IAMPHAVDIKVPPYDLASRVVCEGTGEEHRARGINRGETAVAEQKAMPHVIGIKVESHDLLPGRVDPTAKGRDGTWKIKRSEIALTQQKAMARTGITVLP